MKSFYSHALKTLVVAAMTGMATATASGPTATDLTAQEAEEYSAVREADNKTEEAQIARRTMALDWYQKGITMQQADHHKHASLAFSMVLDLVENPHDPLHKRAKTAHQASRKMALQARRR